MKLPSALRIAVATAALTQFVAAIDTYDVVIIGSGPGGLVAAEFLSRDPSVRVLVLEAGGPSLQESGGTDGPAYAASKGFTKFDIPGEYDGAGSIFSNTNAGYRVDWISDEASFLGKLVGGCSSINAALYFRTPDSYVANTKWPFSPAKVTAGFDAIDQLYGHTDRPSADGELYLQEAYGIVSTAFKQYGQYKEVTINEAAARNSKNKTFGHAPFTIKGGLRDSPAKVAMRAIKARTNAKLIPYATASYIKHYRGRASGVVYNSNVEIALSSRGAVLMAAGAMSTPKVLIQSGIGPIDQLTLLSKRTDFPGVAQTAASNGWVVNDNVGKNLFDTNAVFASFSHPQMKAVPDKQSQQWAINQYMNQNQTGVLAMSGPVLIAYENYAVNGRGYEFQTTISPNGFGEFKSNLNAFFAALYINNPESRDYSSFNADGKWVGFTTKKVVMSSANDVAAMKSYTKKVVNMLQQNGATFLSAAAGESVDAWVDRNKAWKTNHFGGSCYASSDVADTKRCVDESLRVVGTTNVFVGDASVQKEGTVNPYGFVMYAGYEAGNAIKTYLANGPPSLPQCGDATIESNVDYVGLDIGSASSTTAAGCCALCQDTNGCQAFSWTSGTCYLKSSKGAAIANAGVHSAVVPVVAPPPTTPTPTTPTPTTPTPTTPTPTTPTPTSTPPTPTTGAPPTCPKIEEGMDYIDNDLSSTRSDTAEGCCALCRQDPACRAFTWTSYNSGTCWLKSAKGATKLTAGARSVEIRSSCATIEENTDYTGTDVGNTLASTAEACCSLCRAQSNCKAYTWTNYNGGTCWFKNAKGSGTTKTGARSATLL